MAFGRATWEAFDLSRHSHEWRRRMNGEPTRGAKRQARNLQWSVSGLCLWARAMSRHSSNASHIVLCSAKIVLKGTYQSLKNHEVVGPDCPDRCRYDGGAIEGIVPIGIIDMNLQ